MASQVLPQALHMVPRNPIQSLSNAKNLGFSTFLSRAPSPLTIAPISVSRVRLNNSVGSILGSFSKLDFVVRAEASPEGEVAVEAEAGDEAALGEEVEDGKKAKEPRKRYRKLGNIMKILNTRAVEASQSARPIPELRVGDILELKFDATRNRRRLAIYKGIIISKQNAGIHTTIRLRRIIAGIGVEIVFPIYSPSIKEIKVVKHRKVRQARLYYLRDKLPRLSTFK